MRVSGLANFSPWKCAITRRRRDPSPRESRPSESLPIFSAARAMLAAGHANTGNMPVARRTPRDERRRRLGQNCLRPELADRLVADAAFRGGELVVEVCAGPGPITLVLARRAVDVAAVEVDPVWARRLRDLVRQVAPARVQVMEADILSLRLRTRPFPALASLQCRQTP